MKTARLTEADALLLLQKRPQPFSLLVKMGERAIKRAECKGARSVRNDLYIYYFYLMENGLVKNKVCGKQQLYRLSEDGLVDKKDLLGRRVGSEVVEIGDLYEEVECDDDES